MWVTQTRQFDRDEMASLEHFSAEELAPGLLASPPIVALRALAEIMLNGDDSKLEALLANAALAAHWQRYSTDPQVDPRDHGYADHLRARLPQ